MRKLLFFLFIYFFWSKTSAQTNFVYGINGGIGISRAHFDNQNDIKGLHTVSSNFVSFNFSIDWHMGNNFRMGLAGGLDEYKDKYRFDEIEYLYFNHPDLYKNTQTISSIYTQTNAFPVPSLTLDFSYEYKVSSKIGVLPFVGFKFNYVPIYRDSLANQLSIGSSIVPDFIFNDWLYRPNEFNPSFILGAKFRWYASKKYLFQLSLGYEYLTKNLKQGTLRINYLGKDSREQVYYRGNNINIKIGILRYKSKKFKKEGSR